jgi:hypothetical protein
VICRLYKKNKIPAQQQNITAHFRNTFLFFFCTPRVKVFGFEFLHIRNTLCESVYKNFQMFSPCGNSYFENELRGARPPKALTRSSYVYLPAATRALLRGYRQQKMMQLKSNLHGQKKPIKARFRSWDMWVMGPPSLRCATLILLLNLRRQCTYLNISVSKQASRDSFPTKGGFY